MKLTAFNEQVYLDQLVGPVIGATGTVPASYVDAGLYERFVILIGAGDMGTSGTIDAQVVQATAAAGTGSKNITGAAITQLVTATDDDSFVTIEVQSDQLDLANGFNHVSVTITIGGAACNVVAYFLGLNPRSVPVTQPATYLEAVQVAG